MLSTCVVCVQVASSTLDASAKIYAGRVDAIHSETYKMLSGLGCGADKNTNDNGIDIKRSMPIHIFTVAILSYSLTHSLTRSRAFTHSIVHSLILGITRTQSLTRVTTRSLGHSHSVAHSRYLCDALVHRLTRIKSTKLIELRFTPMKTCNFQFRLNFLHYMKSSKYVPITIND